ncbi:MAG: hypothetical protein IT335_15150, partial [Thermomicrobiales bacterium]|nr:hypothetical protein [Thermomicrobiales bacterium]
MSDLGNGRIRTSRRSLLSGAAAAGGIALVTSSARRATAASLPGLALQSSTPGAGKPGGTLIIGTDVSPVGLDPALTTAFASVAIYEQMYSSLLTLDFETNNVIPDLAESWENVDEQPVEFKLRQGVRFHSGREVTAEDVKYTFDRLMDENVAVPLRSYLGPDVLAEVIDTYTVRLANSVPYAPLVSVVADRRPCSIVDREVIEANGDLANWDGGSGPFKLVEYTPDVHVILERNDEYYEEGLPYLDRLEFRIIPDETARIAAIRSGEVDLTVLKDPRLVGTLRGDDNVVINEVPSFWRSGTAINHTHEPLGDLRVRQAISHGINRQELIDTVLIGDGQITGPIPPGETFWAVPATPENFPTYAYDEEKARQLVLDAGVDGLEITIDASPAYA